MSFQDFAPDQSIFVLSAAAFCFYLAARLGVDALSSRGKDSGGRVLAHWLPMVAVAMLAIRHNPSISITIIFASSVACVSLVLGATLLAAPVMEFSGPNTRAWGMVLPAAILALLAGFSGHFTLIHAAIFAIQGLLSLMMWAAPADSIYLANDLATALPANDSARRNPLIIALQLCIWIVLGLTGAWLAVRSASQLSEQIPRLTPGVISALMIAPALVLPIIGSSLNLARQQRGGEVVSLGVGCVLLNLGALLPIVIVGSRITGTFPEPALIPLFWRWMSLSISETPLPFPMAVWRIDTVLLIVLGAMLLLASTGRWAFRRLDGAGLLIAYALYMAATAALAGRL